MWLVPDNMKMKITKSLKQTKRSRLSDREEKQIVRGNGDWNPSRGLLSLSPPFVIMESVA